MTIHVVGNACVDLSFWLAGDVPAGATVLARRWRRRPGGKGLNQATAAARAGARVVLWAAVGDDGEAEAIQAHLVGEGIGQQGLAYRPGPSDISAIWIGPDGENRIVSAADQAFAFRPADDPQFRGAIAAGDVVAGQGNLAPVATENAFRLARANGARTALNPSPVRDGRHPDLALVDLVVLNREEAAAASGLGDPFAALAWLRGRAGGSVVVTLGADGAALAEPGQPIRQWPAPRVAAVDTSGAGDALFGTLLALWAAGRSLGEALPGAIAVAARAVERPGALDGLPPAGEVLRLIAGDASAA
ncbi:MAG: PfkB family carbohydrate kinase [Alphaproteobacteria bacterium]